MSCGPATSCGIRMNGSVECWGRNNSGQSNPPDNKFKQISVGFDKHSCGIIVGGDVICWGSNSRGQGKFTHGKFENYIHIFLLVSIYLQQIRPKLHHV